MTRASGIVVLVSGTCLACGAGDHDSLARLAERVTALEAKVTGLAATPTPSGALPKTDPPYEPPEPGWSISGGARRAYAVHLDPTALRDGHPTVRLAPTGDTGGNYGTWARGLDASPYLGKRVRFTIYTKTQGTTQRADFWARVQAADSPGDGDGLGGHWTYLPPSSDWTRQEIVLDVDRGGSYLNYGVGIAGPGVLWFDAPTVEIVGDDVPVTPKFPGEQTVNDWLMTGVGAPDFKLEADEKSARITRVVESSRRFVAVVRAVAAEPFVGKAATVAFDVRTDGLDGGGMCILKVQTERELAYGGFLALEMKDVPASTPDFMPCALHTTVPTGAKWILYGFSYRGGGKAWVRGGTVK